MNRRDQNGLASIIVVGILMVILTLISVGFATLMNRTVKNAQNRQLNIAASYAVQTGINDAAAYLIQNPNARAPACDSLLKGDQAPLGGPSNISGDGTIGYDCVLINPTPDSLVFQQVPAYKSQVVRITTCKDDACTPANADKLTISWQSSDSSKNAFADANCNSPSKLLDETAWNNSSCVAMLRLTVYPVSDGTLIKDVQAQSKTFFLRPSPSGGSLDYNDTDGKLITAHCVDRAVAAYQCSLSINNNLPNVDYLYIRLTPLYSQADIKIKANHGSDALNFKNIQAIIDVTAKAGPSTKRLQARVDISRFAIGDSSPLPTIEAGDDVMPEDALRSANTLCKRLQLKAEGEKNVRVDGDTALCQSIR